MFALVIRSTSISGIVISSAYAPLCAHVADSFARYALGSASLVFFAPQVLDTVLYHCDYFDQRRVHRNLLRQQGHLVVEQQKELDFRFLIHFALRSSVYAVALTLGFSPCVLPASWLSNVVSMKTLKVSRSAGGGGMQSISNTSCPAPTWLDGFSFGL